MITAMPLPLLLSENGRVCHRGKEKYLKSGAF